MEMFIKFADGDTQVIKLDCAKEEVAYEEEETGIAKIYIRDELVHIVNLNHVAYVQFI